LIYHILNGDALKSQLPNLNGETIVIRESLMDGPVNATDLDSFFIEREKYICSNFEMNPEEYLHKSKREIQKITNIKAGSEVNLWFEDDLFCQSNLWFCCYILQRIKEINVYLVRPDHQDWAGFGIMNKVRLLGHWIKNLC